MSYYTRLGLQKEPFSTSPDPDFFYHSQSHLTALRRLEIALRLKRGLSLILGDIGTGKTTLWRTLVQEFNEEKEFIFHIMLDPGFRTEDRFLRALTKLFGCPERADTPEECKDALERYLFRRGVDEGKTVVLIIDEGQKLDSRNIELLRTLLNFETNECKLLQLAIFAQKELESTISRLPNFTDRIALKYTLNPFNARETGAMIEFRLHQAGYNSSFPLFTDKAVTSIHARSAGYPRKILRVCHEALKTAAVQEALTIDDDLLGKCVDMSGI